jgi:serine/threonine protein kinase
VKPQIIHRDLKPDNILISLPRGEPKISDFGLSRAALDSENALMTRVVGSPAYMAPEVLSGDYGTAADVFSFGIILSEMWGNHPFGFKVNGNSNLSGGGGSKNSDEVLSHNLSGGKNVLSTLGTMKILGILAKGKIEPVIPPQAPDIVGHLIRQCVEWDPDLRPNFEDIVLLLGKAAYYVTEKSELILLP